MGLTASVIVPSYGGEHRLPDLFEALAGQDARRTWEVVVVLDGTPDNSRQVVEAWTARLPIRLVDLPTNMGRAAALNRGFEAARYDVLIRCDDDLMPRSDYLDRHCRWHESREDCGVVGLYRNVFPPTRYAEIYGRVADRRYATEAYQRASTDRWVHWAGNCSVHRRMWERVGPYDDKTYEGYGYEDIDWGFRLVRAGAEIVLDAALETEHRVAATTAAIRLVRAYDSGAARARFALRHRRPATAPGRGPWSWAVSAGSVPKSQRTYARIGKILDASLRVLPPAAGRKAIDFWVEAAERAGNRTIMLADR